MASDSSGVDSEVIAEIENRIAETERDIEVSLTYNQHTDLWKSQKHPAFAAEKNRKKSTCPPLFLSVPDCQI